MKKWHYFTGAIIIFMFAYLLGLLTVRNEWPLYSLLEPSYHITPKPNETYMKETNPLNQYFIQPVSEYDKLIYPPVTTSEELNSRINEFMVNIDSFENAFNRIEILSSSVDDHILMLQFKYMDSEITAYAFYKPALNKNMKNVGINIIPGSGTNQSSAMFYNKRNNYQSNIDDIVQHYGDVYILVKPNEDFLAIHNGTNKISGVPFVNYLINKGSSYSAYYMIQGLALSKFIKQEYENLYVCGLSQGGLAALINSLQSNPERAVIASGFSVLMRNPYKIGLNQIIIPDYRKFYNPDGVKLQIKKTDTQFLFTWGEKESGLYGRDAGDRLTAQFFKGMKNVQTYIHPEGHVYYEPAITDFFEN